MVILKLSVSFEGGIAYMVSAPPIFPGISFPLSWTSESSVFLFSRARTCLPSLEDWPRDTWESFLWKLRESELQPPCLSPALGNHDPVTKDVGYESPSFLGPWYPPLWGGSRDHCKTGIWFDVSPLLVLLPFLVSLPHLATCFSWKHFLMHHFHMNPHLRDASGEQGNPTWDMRYWLRDPFGSMLKTMVYLQEHTHTQFMQRYLYNLWISI